MGVTQPIVCCQISSVLSLISLSKTHAYGMFWGKMYVDWSWSSLHFSISQTYSWISATATPSGAYLCWALGDIICNFTPILPCFQHWGDEAWPLFFSRKQIKWRPKKKVFAEKSPPHPTGFRHPRPRHALRRVARNLQWGECCFGGLEEEPAAVRGWGSGGKQCSKILHFFFKIRNLILELF